MARQRRDIAGFVSFGHLPLTGPFPVTGCYSLNTCRADFNNDTIVTTADIPALSQHCSPLVTAQRCRRSRSGRCHLPISRAARPAIERAAGCNVRVADDFRVVGGNLTSICWYGFYVNLAGGTICTQRRFGKQLRVTFYNDNVGVLAQSRPVRSPLARRKHLPATHSIWLNWHRD
jgi:hypothetical protein